MECEGKGDTCNGAVVHFCVPVPAFFVCVLWACYGDVLPELGNDEDGDRVLPHTLAVFLGGAVPPVFEVTFEGVGERLELFQGENGALPSSTRRRSANRIQ